MSSKWVVSCDADGWWVVLGDKRHGPFLTERGAEASARTLVDLQQWHGDDDMDRAKTDDGVVVVLGFCIAAIVALIVAALVLA